MMANSPSQGLSGNTWRGPSVLAMPFHSTNYQIHLPSTLRLLVSYLRVFRSRQPSFALLQVLLTGNVTLTGLLGRFDRLSSSSPYSSTSFLILLSSSSTPHFRPVFGVLGVQLQLTPCVYLFLICVYSDRGSHIHSAASSVRCDLLITRLLGRFDRASPTSSSSSSSSASLLILLSSSSILSTLSSSVWSSRCSAAAGTPQVQGGVFC
jgi:hypothetical protein